MLTITILYIFDSVFFCIFFSFQTHYKYLLWASFLEVNFGLKITSLNIFPFFFFSKYWLDWLNVLITNQSVCIFSPKNHFQLTNIWSYTILSICHFANQLQKFNTSTLNLLSASPIGENKFMSVEGISSWWNVLVLKHFLQDSSYRLHGYNQVSMI